MMATDLAEEPKEEAPRKPPQKPAPYAPVAGQAAEIVALRTELAAVKAQASKELLAMQEERDKARALAQDWCKRHNELERVTKGRPSSAVYDPGAQRYLLDACLVDDVLAALRRWYGTHEQSTRACNRLEDALMNGRHARLPAALPDMREGESLDGFVFGGPAHGERWKCTGRVLVLPQVSGPDARYQLREVQIGGKYISCWFLDEGRWAELLWRLAARPNAKPELRGHALTNAFLEAYATGKGTTVRTVGINEMRRTELSGYKADIAVHDEVINENGKRHMTATEVREMQAKLQEAKANPVPGYPNLVPGYPREEEDDGA
jgi:hypothetical protein